ncbi:hypothetical protein SDC9_113426 [bioreactor metagenome]|uniref:Uncharacterized protein n=1 Tax=bioreactor metagenome TaxID=1076179 RepID=A0A645BMQ0_9ZZZZ
MAVKAHFLNRTHHSVRHNPSEIRIMQGYSTGKCRTIKSCADIGSLKYIRCMSNYCKKCGFADIYLTNNKSVGIGVLFNLQHFSSYHACNFSAHFTPAFNLRTCECYIFNKILNVGIYVNIFL